MMIFGHLGMTFGVMKGVEFSLSRILKEDVKFHYGVIALGALLPDIIDKPLIQILYGLKDHDSHIFAHSPIFAIVILLIGYVQLFLQKKGMILLVGIGTLLHQMFDKGIFFFSVNPSPELMQQGVRVLSHLGLNQNQISSFFDGKTYFSDVILYLTVPYIFLTEMVGFVIMIVVIWNYIRRGKRSAKKEQGDR